jgi:hypothetical protein
VAIAFADKSGSYDIAYPFAESYSRRAAAGEKRRAEEHPTNPKGKKA